MANAFMVTSSALKKLAEELEQLNSQYLSKVEELASKEQELRSMWEGEANQAFQKAFANDKVSLDNFHKIIMRYIQAILTAVDVYNRAEQQATQTATTRTYR